MSISNKYGIPQETVTRMVKDGVLSCSWPFYEEVYYHYKKLKSEGEHTAYQKTMNKYDMARSTLHYIIHKFE